jgi:hypothetical protein
MAQVYKADGTVEDYPEPANGSTYNLEELKRAIGGGWIQIVATRDRRLMVVDEEGKLKHMPLNVTATRLYIYGDVDPIVGDALVCDPNQIE